MVRYAICTPSYRSVMVTGSSACCFASSLCRLWTSQAVVAPMSNDVSAQCFDGAGRWLLVSLLLLLVKLAGRLCVTAADANY